jgi:uncharacterized protein involved in exopolysaccharide biosynthesis
MIALQGDDLVFAVVGGTCLGILLALFDDWFNRRQRRKRRHR